MSLAGHFGFLCHRDLGIARIDPLALYFMHEIRETSDIRFMPEISLTNV